MRCKIANYVLMQTHTTLHANDMIYQYIYTLFVYVINMLVTTILAKYTIYVNLYCITHFTTHISYI